MEPRAASVKRHRIAVDEPDLEQKLLARLNNIAQKKQNCAKPVGTWISPQEKAILYLIAKANRVSISAYLRSMIIDVIAEEGPKLNRMSKE